MCVVRANFALLSHIELQWRVHSSIIMMVRAAVYCARSHDDDERPLYSPLVAANLINRETMRQASQAKGKEQLFFLFYKKETK